MMTTSKISIIIPSYNQQEYLPDAIQSVLDQTVLCEVVVVDDGSTDDSLKIAGKYPVKLVSQANKGLASARNTGIMNASGEYCLFLDADDMLLPEAVEKIVTAIEETKADVVAPSLKEFGMSSAPVILMPNPRLEDFRVGNRVGYCQAIRRSTLLDAGGYSCRMREGYEDLHLTINLLTKGAKLVTLPDILWLYRTKENSMITTAKQHHWELLAQINKDFPEAQLRFNP